MAFLLSFLIVLLSALSLSYIWQKRFEFTLPIVLSALSLLLYASALIDQRQAGVVTAVVMCAAGIVFSLRKFYKTRELNSSDLFSPGFFFVVGSMAIIFLISRNFVLNDWDEFAQWGLVLKNMFYNNGLAVAQGTTAFHQSYPEGVSLVQSFFNQFNTVLSEPNMLRSLLFLSLAQLGIAYVGVKRVGWKKGLMIAAALTALPYIFFANFHGTIYIDAFIGLLVGNILFFDYIYPKKDAFYSLYMGLQLTLLASSKQIGILLAVIIGIIVILKWINLTKGKTFLNSLRAKPKREVAYALIPLVFTTIITASWSIYVGIHHLKDIIEVQGLSLRGIYDVFVGSGAPEYRYVTYYNFLKVFVDARDFGVFTLSYFTLTILLFIAIYFVYPRKSQRMPWFATGVIGMLYAYSAALLLLYLFAFMPYEAQMVASIGRYIGTALLGVTMFVIMIIYSKYSEDPTINNRTPIVPIVMTAIVLMAANMPSLIQVTVFARQTNAQNSVSRSRYDSVKKYLPLFTKGRDKIYIIAQSSDGHAYWRLRYNFTPIDTSPNRTWSIGSGPLYEGDIWSQTKTEEEWASELAGYTYVYIDAEDDVFVKNFGNLFEDRSQIKNTALYKVEKNGAAIKLFLVSLPNEGTK